MTYLDVDLINFLVARTGKDRLYTFLHPRKDSLRVFISPIDILKPHEDIDEYNLYWGLREILSCGYLKYPIVVDSRTLLILD